MYGLSMYPYLRSQFAQPEERDALRGFLLPRSYAGQAVDPEAARSARNQGLLSLGAHLLAASKDGDFAGGLSRGALEMTGTMNEQLERSRQISRQEKLDELQRRQMEDQLQTSAQAREQGAERFGREQTVWGQQDERRENTERSASSMLAAIEQVAGPDSPEVARARSLAQLGEDADIARLEQLHEAVTARSRRDDDADWKARQTVEDAQLYGESGFGPIAEGRRADAGLDLDRQRTALYGQQVARSGSGGDPSMKPGALNDDIRSEVNSLMNDWLSVRKMGVGEVQNDIFMDPKKYAEWKRQNPGDAMGIPYKRAPTAQELERQRAIFEQQVIQRIQQRTGQGAPQGVAPGVYQFDSSGNLVPR